jgi:hypothetical protein
VPEEVRVWFNSLIASILYVSKRTKPEYLVAGSVLATKIYKFHSDSEDYDKLIHLVRHIRGSKDKGIVLRLEVSSIRVHL